MKRFSSIIKRISRVLKRRCCRKPFDELTAIYNGKTYKDYWYETYGHTRGRLFATIKIKREAQEAFIQGGFRPDEFHLYRLENQSKGYRDCFMSQKRKDDYLISYYGPSFRDVLEILKDKYVFYTYLKDFFKRDVSYIKSEQDRLSFLSFCNQHSHFFAKLNKGSCGRGCRVYTLDNPEQANAIFNELVGSGEWIVEEVIKQDAAISQFNSSSVNTIRFPSFKKNGVVKSVFPCLRFGRAGSIVDNAGQGGMFVSIDQNTGEIITDAIDEKGNVFVEHPDSKISFRGFHVPQWDSIIETVKNAHLALPDNQVYVAFDLALSDKGWCIVEGNWGDWILQQASLQKGLGNEFTSLLFGEWAD